ncbi:HPr kinase/phosphorylase [Anoxybacter fermentans]|uniref:HPr kinase/phosphorylase n=1 Tax=Anoxybacter fermentans TaxID=1323375 RepID=A0A3Q9HNT8_9FIRM|nr:HPr(Ser) kinase/phosphatase [Anoxybacter fermentans]AZR72242.1 HPr kinase/phosphorylase [Anoxybacter fermentans]
MSLTIQELISHFKLELLAGRKGLKNKLMVTDIKRPGIELAGYWKYFTPERIQLLGRTEINFLSELSFLERKERLIKFFSYQLPGVIITRNLKPPEPMIQIAKETGVPLLRVKTSTTRFLSQLTDYLEKKLAPSKTVHGVLVEVYGVGVLLIGESGIGKSETALELVKRGHRLIADDVVELKRIGASTLVGTALKINQHYMELRGIGIIDVKTLFGAGAIKSEQVVHMIIELEDWKCQKDDYDRLGLNTATAPLLGVEIPKVVVPVRPGRNLTTIIEVAAMNHRLKCIGFDAAKKFTRQLEAEISRKREKNTLKGE